MSIYRHFGVYTKIVKAGVSSKEIIDYKLSRHACYLIVQNANSKYKNVSLGQNYFSAQTMRMEITDKEFLSLSEDLPTPEKSIKELEKDNIVPIQLKE